MEIKGYSIGADVAGPFDAALQRTKDALAEEGFGIIMMIDMAEKLHEKLGVTMERYVILGACIPALAHQALQAEKEIGLLLPCNLIVHETPDGVSVAAINPRAALSLAQNKALEPIAAEVEKRLRRTIARLDRS